MYTSTTTFRYTKSHHTPQEKRASTRLVRESFGSNVDIGYEEYYDWQYLQNPVGEGMVLLVYDGETAVAQETLIPCMYQIANVCEKVVLRMNACVSPDYRKKGIMMEMKRRLHEFYGYTPLSIGIPSSMNSSSRRSGYYPMPMTLLIRPLRLSNYFDNRLAKSFLRPFDKIWKKANRGQVYEHSGVFDGRFDELARLTYNTNTIRQVRDSSFLNWRYKSNPRREYTTLIATESGEKVEGYIILRVTEVAGIQAGLVMDFICKDDKPESGQSLIRAALEFFWSNDVVFASAACFPGKFEYNLLRKAGFLKCPDRFRPHPLTVWLNLLDESKLSRDLIFDTNRWFFMLGDYETF